MRSYYFTVTTGRAGQGSFTAFLQRNVPNCYAAFEEPQIKSLLPNPLGHYERRLRRRFVETHELLGRGKVLSAFEAADEAYLDVVAARRQRFIDKRLRARDCTIYVDVSKYFARGLHKALLRRLPEVGLIRLVRDPIMNMRSFLNRNKDFRLDNSAPEAQSNLLRLAADELDKGELYLWAWCEMYLRFDALVEEFAVERAVEIRTHELESAAAMTAHLDALGMPHGEVTVCGPENTNLSLGFGATEPGASDVATFWRFLDRLPADIRARIPYFETYQAKPCP